MPILRSEKINSNSWWALWHITESFETLLELSHSADINSFYNENIKHPLKQKEWLAARLVLKYLSEKLGYSYHGSKKNSFGKPFLIDSPMYVSITNSYPFAAGIICSKGPVGIDLEYPKSKLLTLAPKFLSKDELLKASDDLIKLCIYWCAKETLFKIYGRDKISFKENLFIFPFYLNQAGTIEGTISTERKILKYDICYNIIDAFTVCYNIN
ncbi:MAG: 4'-phosphopantetheinyl transferase superfamily protein [Bacteroidota bacterium]|nr:4'-phosphopantetheinyl transferase superfamily protein [Bacteroidota bacterium]